MPAAKDGRQQPAQALVFALVAKAVLMGALGAPGPRGNEPVERLALLGERLRAALR
jgi:hypothetical protein